MNKRIALGIVLILIIGTIFYFESKNKVNSINGNNYIINVSHNEEIKGIIDEKSLKYKKAVELVNPDGYINTDNITIADLIGKKIILVDFWTYSCINCQRTIPYINNWYETYKDKGLVIIGVHTPEFEFEKDYSNVNKAVSKFNITYPVILDNNALTWGAYNNHYWPRKYLIDIDGFIVYDHIGEGGYEETEKVIQDLIKERNERLNIKSIDIAIKKPQNTVDVNFNMIETPEIYLGVNTNRGNFNGISLDEEDYNLPKELKQDYVYLEGRWLGNPESSELKINSGKIVINFGAKKANIVAGSKNGAKLMIYVDGNYIKDVYVKDFGLYELVSMDEYSRHNLEVIAESGLQAYTFTFG